MYYTLYCNEQMLLDNWKYYGEGDRLQASTLRKTDLTTRQKVEFYYRNMHIPDTFAYENGWLTNKFRKRKGRPTFTLRTATEVHLYQQDLDYVENAISRYELNRTQAQILFGAIFLCRLFQNNCVRLDTQFKQKRFMGCFNTESSMFYVSHVSGDTWEDDYCTVHGIDAQAEKYGLLIRDDACHEYDKYGYNYTYPAYELPSDAEPVYTFHVTKENNRLCIIPIFDELIGNNMGRCRACGRKMEKLGKCHLYCEHCTAEVNRIKTKMRLRRFKAKKRALQNPFST